MYAFCKSSSIFGFLFGMYAFCKSSSIFGFLFASHDSSVSVITDPESVRDKVLVVFIKSSMSLESALTLILSVMQSKKFKEKRIDLKLFSKVENLNEPNTNGS
eukprot:619589_1